MTQQQDTNNMLRFKKLMQQNKRTETHACVDINNNDNDSNDNMWCERRIKSEKSHRKLLLIFAALLWIFTYKLNGSAQSTRVNAQKSRVQSQTQIDYEMKSSRSIVGPNTVSVWFYLVIYLCLTFNSKIFVHLPSLFAGKTWLIKIVKTPTKARVCERNNNMFERIKERP